jgi:hypothetical protein
MKNWTRFVFVLLLICGAGACGKDSEDDIPDTRGRLLVYQMIPGGARFDVLLDTATLGSNLAYGESTNTYREFRAQKYNLYVYPAGNHTVPIMAGELNLRHGKNLSAFLTADRNDTLRVLVAEDDNTISTTSGNARMRIINLSNSYFEVGSGANTTRRDLPLDFYLNYVDEKSQPVYRALNYGAVTAPAEIRLGNYDVDINWTDSSKVLQTFPFRADSGKVYTLIATGDARGTNFKMFQFAQ